MFRQDYERIKKLKERITKHYEARLARMNSEITMRDIFAYAQDIKQIHGEFDLPRTDEQREHMIARLYDHIELLANITNILHS